MKKLLIIALISTGFFTGCSKDRMVSTPDFNVSVANTKLKVGDTVRFSFSGKADFVTFYSGEAGKNFLFKNRESVDSGNIQLQFQTLRQNGTTQENTLKLLVSDNFDNTFDSLRVPAAIWTDITSRCVLSTGTTTASGIVDLTDFAKAKKPVHLAFKYSDTLNTVTTQRRWTINGFSLRNVLSDNTMLTVSDYAGARWRPVNVLGPVVWAVTTTQFSIGGAAINAPSNEDWIITRKIDLFEVKADIGVALKGYSENMPAKLDYVFKTPGSYEVVFEARNQNIKEEKSLVRRITITVAP